MSKKVGRKPYGRTQKQLEAIRFMRRQRNLYLGRRKSFCEIANLLNERNQLYPKGSKKHFPPPAGKCWYGTTVENILKRVEGIELRERTKNRRDYLDIPQTLKLWDFINKQCQNGTWRTKR